MVRIPTFSRRSDEVATRDENGDGRIDDRDDRIARDDTAEATPTTYRGRAVADTRDDDLVDRDRTRTVDRDRDGVDDRLERRDTDTDVDRDGVPDSAERGPVVVKGPRPRASVFATVGLILGVIAALAVLTGTLAAYGIGAGVLGLLASLAGFSATSRRHVAGKSDAMVGLLLSVGAIIVGSLVLTGSMAWTTDTDQVGRLRDWLDANIADRF